MVGVGRTMHGHARVCPDTCAQTTKLKWTGVGTMVPSAGLSASKTPVPVATGQGSRHSWRRSQPTTRRGKRLRGTPTSLPVPRSRTSKFHVRSRNIYRKLVVGPEMRLKHLPFERKWLEPKWWGWGGRCTDTRVCVQTGTCAQTTKLKWTGVGTMVPSAGLSASKNPSACGCGTKFQAFLTAISTNHKARKKVARHAHLCPSSSKSDFEVPCSKSEHLSEVGGRTRDET